MRNCRLHLVALAALAGGTACATHDVAVPRGAAAPLLTAQESEPPRAARDDRPSMRDLDADPPAHVTFRSAEIDWRPGPDSFEQGSRFAVLEGDPGEQGVFTMRIALPDGFVIAPHWHPNVERVTVLQGTFRLGMGTEFDEAAAEPLPAGSYTSMPRGMVHYAVAEGETVLQLSTVGPWEIHYVDPEDDPRTRSSR